MVAMLQGRRAVQHVAGQASARWAAPAQLPETRTQPQNAQLNSVLGLQQARHSWLVHELPQACNK
jgi:hypothetical protein